MTRNRSVKAIMQRDTGNSIGIQSEHKNVKTAVKTNRDVRQRKDNARQRKNSREEICPPRTASKVVKTVIILRFNILFDCSHTQDTTLAAFSRAE